MTTELIVVSSIIFIGSAVLLLFLIYGVTRSFRSRKGLPAKDTSPVGFVVDTFNELVTRLKEKERELEILRKRAEDRATAIEGYNENILQSVQSGVISFDQDLRITRINRAASLILEIPLEHAVGQRHEAALRSPITDLLSEKKVIERGETRYVTPSGKSLWLGLSLSPLKNRDGETIGQLLIFTDLTHLKAIESQIELRNRLSSLGELSAGIAHELRNPMAVIAGYTKLLSKKVDGSLKQTVDSIAREIAVMDRIITDFLSFARPVELNPKDVDLKGIIHYCLMATTEKRNDIELHISIGDLPSLKGDELLLRQAFVNLLQNALDAMPQGGKLTIVATPLGTDFLDITVSDTGHGIAEEMREKIFLPFFTTKQRGTGLGLAIAHNIVVSHGGTIHVESTDAGTTFRVRLPLKTL